MRRISRLFFNSLLMITGKESRRAATCCVRDCALTCRVDLRRGRLERFFPTHIGFDRRFVLGDGPRPRRWQ
jgi:hypothetical protein